MEFVNDYKIISRHDNVLNRLADTFSDQGYKIEKKTDSILELVQIVAPNSNRSNSITGVSKFSATVHGETLSVKADLSGYKRLFTFLGIMILGLAVLFIVLFGIIVRPGNKTFVETVILAVLPLCPWPILLPLMYKLAVSRTVKQLNVLLNNVCNFD